MLSAGNNLKELKCDASQHVYILNMLVCKIQVGQRPDKHTCTQSWFMDSLMKTVIYSHLKNVPYAMLTSIFSGTSCVLSLEEKLH